ncbi:MAG: DNA-binding protein WhiA [Lachnospiraceae bacterium]|nr:DNA-binding protein WhiA [Lachnospiraceae bacterium]
MAGSFAQEVKAEIAAVIPPARHCRLASAAAILSCIGSFREGEGGKKELFISTENRPVLRKCFTLLQKTVNIKPVLLMDSTQAVRASRIYGKLEMTQTQLEALMRALQMTGDDPASAAANGTVAAGLLEKVCCRRSYLREMFLCTGSVNHPRGDYHLEFSCTGTEQAMQLREVLRGFSLDAKVVERRKASVVYLKDSADIVDLLNLIGAQVSMMEMENQRILKGLRSSVNRRVNCETANIGKAVSAARRQVEDIRYLEKQGLLGDLPGPLREMAELRLRNPDVSLRELGELADPPVGKSGVNHRLRKLSEIAGRRRQLTDEES